MASADSPVVFIIHGAWHRPVHLQPLISKLRASGYEGVCYQNPTSDNPPEVKTTPESPQTKYGLAQDVDAVVRNLTALIEEERKRVFVVCHSWGGMICSEAVDQELSAAKRMERGLQGGVIGLLYMCAYLIPKNDKLEKWRYGGPNAPVPWSSYNSASGLLELKDAETYMFNDLDPESQKYWMSLAYLQSPGIVSGFQTKEAFMHYPTTYLYCEKDNAIRIHSQQHMVNLAKERTAIREARCSGSHSPYLSQPGVVCDEVVAAIQWSSNV